jgi:hypothetical protein
MAILRRQGQSWLYAADGSLGDDALGLGALATALERMVLMSPRAARATCLHVVANLPDMFWVQMLPDIAHRPDATGNRRQ